MNEPLVSPISYLPRIPTKTTGINGANEQKGLTNEKITESGTRGAVAAKHLGLGQRESSSLIRHPCGQLHLRQGKQQE